jgi:arsenate reductase-like glutaredoxin family protein
LEDNAIGIAEQVPASRKLGAAEARRLIEEADEIWISKGRKVEAYGGGVATDEIVDKMLGSTGNLRAPTITAGGRLLVGFNEDVYLEVLGTDG